VQFITTAFTTVDARSSHLGFQSRGCEILPTFPAGYPTSGDVPVAISDWEIGNSEYKWHAA